MTIKKTADNARNSGEIVCESLIDYLRLLEITENEQRNLDGLGEDASEKKKIRSEWENVRSLMENSPLMKLDPACLYDRRMRKLLDDAYSAAYALLRNGKPTYYFFRGISNKEYALAPGIVRPGEKEEAYYFHELSVKCPEVLADRSYFGKLSYMQHYGAPTRLLDITGNPLVALYFACGGSGERHDGKVTFFRVKAENVHYETSNRVLMLSHLQELTREEQQELMLLAYTRAVKNDFLKKSKDRYSIKFLEDFYKKIKKESNTFEREIVPFDLLEPIVVRANQNNARMIRQDGAFIMSGLDIDEENSDRKNRQNVIREAIIPSEKKGAILSELRRVGIHKATLFPELESVAQCLKDKTVPTNGIGF